MKAQWKYYHEASKTMMTTENYKNGKLEGLRTVYYPSGKIAEEINYKNGLKNGFIKNILKKELYLEELNFTK